MEGPSLVILREELEKFRGRKVLKVSGNTKQPKESLAGSVLRDIDTWGKQLFLSFVVPRRDPIVTKTHFLMFGSYRIDQPKDDRIPRLQLTFRNGVVYFYACSIKFDAANDAQKLDRRVDLMSERWNEAHVLGLMEQRKDVLLCDLFLDQNVFAGSGNIIKNEVLFNVRRHPLTPLNRISRKDWPRLAHAVRSYCQNFYEWKKRFELRKHWQVYRRSECPLCGAKLVRSNLGKFLRRTFYCSKHQPLHTGVRKLRLFPVLPLKGPVKLDTNFDH